ncbi:hypothetical protein GCM10025768_14280 [Microbacterium pseudoresistens]|uniref:Uncharacterized protein n=1 Tax=Microbacterium pseudoresistens TaxID=640634 RepID=A0A7Y9ESL7_9MICO|nr:hypothetical protein [Microbacterium pseudoresistens]NYD53218.1 hypothetical protein [Microbacterium pseudoresistens]
MRERLLAIAGTAVMILGLAGCTGEASPDSDDETSPPLYCDLISPESVAAIVGDLEVKDFGGPVPKDEYRRVQCSLYSPKGRETLLTVYEYELWSDEEAEKARTETVEAMRMHANDGSQHYAELELDGDDLGYAWFTGDTAASLMLTETRSISVSAPADAAQAGEFTGLLGRVVEEIDDNLDAWDAAHPIDG